jgi:DNA-binding HxlR family transcriptional regulator
MDSLARNKGCDEECPVKKTAEIIEGKWTTLVIRELLPHKKRYSEIQRALNGISPKVLTTRLRMLEGKGLITRTVYATVPPTTEYELTGTGEKLKEVLNAMAEFGKTL